MNYRSDINGLRAIAVLFVLAFHGELGIFPSGFIGVDIFFVISGFLITSMILKSLNKEEFSISDFYARRLWRIQPALLGVIFFTFILATIFYLPADFIDYVKSAKYTTLLTSNQFFEQSTAGYDAPDSAYFLLLHTWSLSIEWQWYLLLPVSLWLLHRYLPPKAIKLSTIAITLCMLVISLVLSDKYPDKSYYFLTSRIFELMIGSSLAILYPHEIKLANVTSSTIGVVSLAALFYCATRKNIVLGYPDYHALIVSIATALLILIGASTNSISSRILSIKPLAFIGVISYSLYLWHWPIFSAGRYLELTENIIFKPFCFALTFFSSYMSYIFIEKKYRKIHMSFLRTVSILVLMPALFLLTLFFLAEKYNGFDWRFGSDLKSADLKISEFNSVKRESCFGNKIDNLSQCVFGSNRPDSKTALMIGDSYSNHLWGFVDVLAKDANINATQFTTPSCLMLPSIYQYDWWVFKDTIYDECHERSRLTYKLINKNKYNYVIIGENWPAYTDASFINSLGDEISTPLNQSRFDTTLKNAIENIINAGSVPVIMRGTFTAKRSFYQCFNNHVKKREKLLSTDCTINQIDENADWINVSLTQAASKYPTLIMIDPKDAQCQNGICSSVIEGAPVYRRGGHITDYASYQYGNIYLKKYGNPFN